jgi:TetR/AcrR family transcriptional regulator of autoinduction and epiphytic fitness
MAPRVKAGVGPGRRERKALQTRRRILDAAERLFVQTGYTATTITAIAEAADVAAQTVYAVFGTKRAILAELLEVRTVGDDTSMPLRDREYWQAMENQADPHRQLEMLAVIATRIGERIGALSQVLSVAAGSDADIAALYQQRQNARYQDQRRLVRRLSRSGALRAGLSEAQATDTLGLLAKPQTYDQLVTRRKWPVKEYERWLAHLLSCALLQVERTGHG